MSEETKPISSVYLHVGNGGVEFKVVDNGKGPEIHVSSGFFGNINQELVVRTTQDGVKALAHVFNTASQANFSAPYCEPARVYFVDGVYVEDSITTVPTED